MNKLIFKHKSSKNEAVVMPWQIKAYLDEKAWVCHGKTFDELMEIYNNCANENNSSIGETEPILIKKCVIGGGSGFIDTINPSFLDNVPVFGVNYFAEIYKTDYVVICDTVTQSDLIGRLYQKGLNIVAQNLPNLSNDTKTQITTLFEKYHRLTDIEDAFAGKLYFGNTSSIAALLYAAYCGYTDIIFVGFDLTEQYSKLWPTKTTWSNPDTLRSINKAVKYIQDKFKLNIYNANTESKIDLPYIDLEKFVKK